jgi:hypothetical protein
VHERETDDESSHQTRPRVALASRENGGTKVTLLWAAETNTVAVLVRDDAAKKRFELLVEPEANPFDVYQHPYAYAAWRGIDYQTTASLRLAA